VPKLIELTHAELALMLDALDDASLCRDTRSRVLKSAIKRGNRRSQAITSGAESPDGDDHRGKSQAYAALAIKVRSTR